MKYIELDDVLRTVCAQPQISKSGLFKPKFILKNLKGGGGPPF
jgi:hypothetical protein